MKELKIGLPRRMKTRQLGLQQGFSLVEIAVVLVIAAIALGGLITAFGPQLWEMRYTQTRNQLRETSDAIVSFAMINRRLPCPATVASTGRESFCTNGFPGGCGAEVFPPAVSAGRTQGRCAATANTGFVPGATLSLPGLRAADGMVVDAWSFPLRYVVDVTQNTTANNPALTPLMTCGGGAATCIPSTQSEGIRNAYYNNGSPLVLPSPNTNVFVCATATGITAGGCNTALQIANPAFLVYSYGANGNVALAASELDELANTNADRVFVSHERTQLGALPNGGFDDLLVWVSLDQLIGKMVAGGVLP